jgi:hypothetical protein
MTIYYAQVRALIDPEQSDPAPDGSHCQDVSVILTDEPGVHETLRPAAVTLPPAQARQLAFDLLVLAEHAERIGQRR